MVAWQGYGLGLSRCKKLCPTAIGLSLVKLFSLSILIEDSQDIDLLSWAHTAYGSGKPRYALIVGSSSFWTDWLEAGTGGGLSTTLRPSLTCGGLGL